MLGARSSRAATPVPLPTRPWASRAGTPQRSPYHALRTHRSPICVGRTRPRPQSISIAHGGNETHQQRDGQQEANMSLDVSLDNTSQPSIKYCVDNVNARYIHGRPDSELVPSRYALKVGTIDVLVVSDGVLTLPGAMLGHNVDPAVRGAWLEDMFLPPDVLEWALNVVLVRSGGRTILVDAGMGVEFPDLPRVGRLVQRLEAAGIDV